MNKPVHAVFSLSAYRDCVLKKNVADFFNVVITMLLRQYVWRAPEYQYVDNLVILSEGDFNKLVEAANKKET